MQRDKEELHGLRRNVYGKYVVHTETHTCDEESLLSMYVRRKTRYRVVFSLCSCAHTPDNSTRAWALHADPAM